MIRLRNRLILVFLAATILPLIVTVAIMTSLLERSLSYATIGELDRLSKSLEQIGREYYQQARQDLRDDAAEGKLPHQTYSAANRADWPETVTGFFESGESERFALSGSESDHLDYLVQHGNEIWVYSRPLGNMQMERLTREYREAREVVELARARDLRRGFTTTLIVLVATVWFVSFVWLIYVANRMSQPILQLTAGLEELASGNVQTRIDIQRQS